MNEECCSGINQVEMPHHFLVAYSGLAMYVQQDLAVESSALLSKSKQVTCYVIGDNGSSKQRC